MAVHAPFHPGTGQLTDRSGAGGHEPLDDVIPEEGSSRTQRWIGWVSVVLTIAAIVAAWRLL